MATETIPKGEYYIDRGTGKMELHFDKASYMALPQDLRSDIKRYFLFSRGKGAWISKGQANTWMPQEVVKKLGFQKTGEIGEKVSFAEKMEAKAERAAERAERYEGYSASARQRQEQLQKQFNNLRGDIAFLTQPGRFAWRDKIVARYERGFAEAEKAKHFAEQSERLEKASTQSQLKSPRYLDNRIKQGEAELRKIERTAEEYRQKGREVPQYLEDRTHDELDKLMFYKKAMGDIGGVKYSQANVNKGDKVKTRFDWGIVKSTGPKNMTIMFTEGGARGMELKLPYAEVKEHQPQKKTEAKVETKAPEVKLLAAPKSESKPSTEAKEPWEMKRKEFVSQREAETKEGYAGHRGLMPSFDESWRKRTAGAHEQLVEDALEEGKSVPAEVLKDYPELGKAEADVPEGTEKAIKKIEQAIRNIQRRKYQRLAQMDYSNEGIELFNENQLAWDLGVSVSDLGSIIPIRRHESLFGGKGIMWAPTKGEMKGAIPKLAEYLTKNMPQKAKKPETKPRKEIVALKAKPSVKQSDRAIAIDRALLAKQVVPVNDPRWLKQPNRFDVRGVDTPGSGRIVSRTGFTDKGKTRMSRRHHRGWKRIKL